MSAGLVPEVALQEPAVAWALAEGQQELAGLGWVDMDAPPAAPGGVRVAARGAAPRYRHTPASRWLPPAVSARHQAARAQGCVTAWDGLELLIARPTWWIGAREHLFTPYGATPACQEDLLARWGLGRALHGGDPARVARLMAILPCWRRDRGTLDAAQQACDAAQLGSPALSSSPPRGVELFVCRGSASWAARPPRIGGLQIQGGALRCPASREAPRPEALHLAWTGAPGRLAEVARLLPVWIALHLHPEAAPSAPRREP